MASVDREARAREAKHLFEWYVSWKPPRWPEFPLEGRKDILIRDSGKYVAAKLLSTGLVTPKEDEERLRNTIGYCQSVFDISEIGEGGHNVGERLSSNIYDVLFAKRRLLGEWEHGDELYRGQFSSEWRLVASYFRNLQLDSNLLEPETQKAELKAMMQYWLSGGRHGGTTKSLLDETERNEKLNELSIRFPDVDFARLTPLEQEAVIQHYMSGTALVDFTTSIEVAAFFATGGDKDDKERIASAPAMGAIFRVARREVEEELELATVRAPELPKHFLRIHRQKGSFLEIRFRRGITEGGLFDRWVFHHTDVGLPFICEPLAITREYLLPAEIAAN